MTEFYIYELREKHIQLEERIMYSSEDLKHLFTYHAPDPYALGCYDDIRTAALEFAKVIVDSTPVCADQTAAIRKLRECVMTANAAIALGGKS